MKKAKKKKSEGKNVQVSPEAHQKMLEDTIKIKPRRTLRAHVNIMNGLSSEL